MLNQTLCLNFIKSAFFLILSFNICYLGVPGISIILMGAISVLAFVQRPLKKFHKADILTFFLLLLIFLLSLLSSIDFFYSLALLTLGYSATKIPTITYFITLALCMISLKIGMYGRLQFESMGPNYTGFFIYLICISLFFNLFWSNRTRVYKYLSLIPSLLPESRAIFLTFLSVGFLVSSGKQKILIIFFSVLAFNIILFLGFFADRSGGSNGERVFLILSVITGNVYGVESNQFSLIGTYSPFRDGGFVQLHNTVATWWYHKSYLLYLLLLLVVYQLGKKFVIFVALMLPLLFITVEPGIFYFFIGITYYQINRWRKDVCST